MEAEDEEWEPSGRADGHFTDLVETWPSFVPEAPPGDVRRPEKDIFPPHGRSSHRKCRRSKAVCLT